MPIIPIRKQGITQFRTTGPDAGGSIVWSSCQNGLTVAFVAVKDTRFGTMKPMEPRAKAYVPPQFVIVKPTPLIPYVQGLVRLRGTNPLPEPAGAGMTKPRFIRYEKPCSDPVKPGR